MNKAPMNKPLCSQITPKISDRGVRRTTIKTSPKKYKIHTKSTRKSQLEDLNEFDQKWDELLFSQANDNAENKRELSKFSDNTKYTINE